ncbi:MAG: BlaI/MecI/CopY family transcriptional regulator [Planctomycetota bacterium]
MAKRYSLSELQLALMRILWDRGEATVGQVHEALRKRRRLAVTTVATLLSRLEKKKLLSHRTEGRQFVYRPRVSETQVCGSMVADLAERVFEGDIAALVSHLLSSRQVTAGDLEKVRNLIEAEEKKRAQRHGN